MAKMEWGNKMPSQYYEVFKPTVGMQNRIAILSMEALIGVQTHWVETPQTKGAFACNGGSCCQCGLFDQALQYYALPIWVYVNPPNPQTGNPGSNEGVFKVLRMAPTVYDMLVQMSAGCDLMNSDLIVIAQPSGRNGTKMMLYPNQGATLLPREMRDQMMAEMGDLSISMERTLQRPASEADWQRMIAEKLGAAPAGTPQGMSGSPFGAIGTVRQLNPSQLYGGQGSQALPPPQGSPFGAQPGMAGYGAPQAAPLQQPQAAPQMRQAAPLAAPVYQQPAAQPQAVPQAQPAPQAAPAAAQPFHPQTQQPQAAQPVAPQGTPQVLGRPMTASPFGVRPIAPQAQQPQAAQPQGGLPAGWGHPAAAAPQGAQPQGFPQGFQAPPPQSGSPVPAGAEISEQELSQEQIDSYLGGGAQPQ